MSSVSPSVRRFTGMCLHPDGEVRASTLTFDGLTLRQIGPAISGEARLDGLLIPGLVNAHTHVELSGLGLVAGGHGLAEWVRAQFVRRAERNEPVQSAELAAVELARLGTAAVSDIAGGDSTAAALVAAGLSGVVQRERLGLDAKRRDRGVAEAPTLWKKVQGETGVIIERPAAHAPYSTHVHLAQALLSSSPRWAVPGSVHLAEDPAELEFLTSASGDFARLLNDLDVDWPRESRYAGPVDWLRQADALGPGVLAVHGVMLTEPEVQTLAESGTTVVLCVRSNLHISGRAPPIAQLLRAGGPLALGTDSLASCPDLDLLGEVRALCHLEPDVPVATWLGLATAAGARALGLHGLGAFTVGARPGVLQLDSSVQGLRSAAPSRRWLVRPGLPTVSEQHHE